MNVLILGFADAAEIDAVMSKWIEENQIFLFNVIVSGLRESDEIPPAEAWAALRGAPRYFVYDDDVQKLSWRLTQLTDFMVIKLNDRTPQWQKNLMMKLKDAGKHGIAIR